MDVAARHGPADDLSSSSTRWHLALGMFGLGATAFLLRALTAFQPSADEPLWLERSERYVHAYLSLDLTGASSIVDGGGTMPGITTAAVGGAAHLIWEALQDVGLLHAGDVPWRFSYAGLSIAQVGMAAGNALLIVALFWVLRSWSSTLVATTAAVLLATEPYAVAHGARLTTDSFVMLFAAVGSFALLAALGVAAERPLDDRRARRMAAVAGLGLGGAVLSKLSVFTLGPFLLGVVIYAAVRARRAGTSPELWRRLAIVAGAGVALIVVLWPAIWTDPLGQLDVLTRSAEQVGKGSTQFFLGEPRGNPGPLFYFVSVPIRMTPWMLLLGIAGAIVTMVNRSSRARTLLMLAYASVPWLVITLSPKKYDRYTLLVWPALAVIAGLLVELLFARARWTEGSARRGAIAVGAVTFAVVLSFLVVPGGASYTNPLTGGSEVAERAIIVGGSLREAGRAIEEREGDACARRRILSDRPNRLFFPCGVLKTRSGVDLLEAGDYVVVSPLQRLRDPEEVQAIEARSRLVERVENRGVHIADVYQLVRADGVNP